MSQLISKIFSGVAIKSSNQAFTIDDTSTSIPFRVLDVNAHSRLMILQGDMLITGDITVNDITVGTLNYTFLNPPIVGGGDVVGPAPGPSTDNAVVRWNGIMGGVIQNSLVIIDDLGDITTPADISAVNGVFSGTLAFSALSGPLPTGLGDVVGPAGATDTAIALYDGATGKLIQNSLLTVDGSGNISRSALPWIRTIVNNFAAGVSALSAGTGSDNTAIGNQSLRDNTTGSSNVSVGFSTMRSNTTGVSNTAVGTNALFTKTTGNSNVAIGDDSLVNLATGGNNIAVGTTSGSAFIAAESDNILIGNVGVAGDTDMIRIGTLGTHVNNSLVGSLSLIDENYVTIGGAGPLTMPNTSSVNIIVPTVIPLPALTINMPVSPFDGQILSISITEDITSLTHNGNGNTLLNPLPTTIIAPISQQWYFRATDSTWYPLYGACPGDVAGPASSTDNAIARFDGTTGRLLQNSVLTVDDSGFISLSGNNYIHQNGGALNFAAGELALDSVTGGTNNTALGQLALENTTTGVHNTAVGSTALNLNTIGNRNVAVGSLALENANLYNNNTAMGYNALNANLANANTAVGFNSLAINAGGVRNTALGSQTLEDNVAGSDNTGIGYQALANNTANNNTALGSLTLASNIGGTGNVAVGGSSLNSNTGGDNNSALGYNSLNANLTGDNNVAVGANALSSADASNNVAVGSNALLANIAGTQLTAIGTNALTLNTGNDNTAVGYNSLTVNNTGINNTAIGVNSLSANLTTNDNTAIGWNALVANTVAENTAVGSSALRTNVGGTGLVAVGFEALTLNTGNNNTAIGHSSLSTNSTGINNVAVGTNALQLNNTTDNNTAMGYGTLQNNVADANTAVGYRALLTNTSATHLVAIGANALFLNDTGDDNTAVGSASLSSNIIGIRNTAVGSGSLALSNNSYNTAMGYNALNVNTADDNTAIGAFALDSNTSGTNNVALGIDASGVNTTGSNNTSLGAECGGSTTIGSRNTCIGRLSPGIGAGSALGVAINDTVLISNDGSGVVGDGEIWIGNTTDHTDVYLPNRTHVDILDLPEFVHGAVGAGGAVVVPVGTSVALIPLTGPFPLATLAGIALPAGTAGDTLRLNFYDSASGAAVPILVTAVTTMSANVESSNFLTDVNADNLGTVWYFSGTTSLWHRIG